MKTALRRVIQNPKWQSYVSWKAIVYALRQPIFLATLIILVGLWGFAEIADAIDERATQRFDAMILRSLRVDDDPQRLIGPIWLDQSLRDITALGGFTVLTMITVSVSVYLCIAGRPKLALFAFAAVASGTVVTFALKDIFDRPRPELVPYLHVSVSTYSFPSGHAMASAIVYLTLGAMLTEYSKSWRLKAYVMTVAIGLTLLIGSTRVFLGVHYPTDVVAGWAAGFAWAYGCRTLVRLGVLATRFRTNRRVNTSNQA